MKSGFLILIFFSLFLPIVNAQQLDFFILKGMQNSPMLNDYRNQLQAIDADSLLITASQKPQVNSHSQILYTPISTYFGYDNIAPNYGSVVDVSQNIFNRKILQNKYETAYLQKRELHNTSKIATSELRKNITNQYITAYTDYQDLKNAETYLGLLNQHKKILHVLVEQAVYKQSDYIALIIESQSSEIEITQLQAQIKTDEYSLKQLCGILDTDSFIPEIPQLQKAEPVNPMYSPLFMQFKIDSLKIGNEQQSIALQYVPKINWYADAGIVSADPLVLYRHLGFSVGLMMSFPIYDGHQRDIQNKKLSISENTRAQYQGYFKNQYASQIRQLNDALLSTEKSLEMMKKQLQSTTDLAELLKSQLNNGNASIIELISNMKNYLLANRNMNRLQVREFEIINELNYLMLQ